MKRIRTLVLVLALLGLLAEPAGARVPSDDDRYSLAGGCFTVETPSDLVVSRSSAGFKLAETGGEPFRLQATDLGEYLLYGTNRDVLALDDAGDLVRIADPARAAIWEVTEAGDGRFTLTSKRTGESLGPVRFTAAEGCRQFPEITTNTIGRPPRTGPAFTEVSGFADLHLHVMAFHAFGGRIHCGRPWSPLGVEEALPDCARYYGPGGIGTPSGGFTTTSNFGTPVSAYDTVGWPTFEDWPTYSALSFEQTYYKWLERTWLSGLRIMTMLAVDNGALCKTFGQPADHPCDEHATIIRSLKDTYKLQDYIDAQSGGPGKGWFRIVKSPSRAREVIHDGKLAVVLGVETSQPFGCGVRNDQPLCDRRDINRGLDQIHRLGVRQMEIINKFDNAFGGVAGDAGTNGLPTNGGNYLETGNFFSFKTCEGPATDQPYILSSPLITNQFLGTVPGVDPGDVPVYPPPPHCNTRGLTDLGEHVLKGMIKRNIMIDPDHLGVEARLGALNLVESERYGGLISSHSWSDVLTYPRVYDAGGMVTPYAGSAEGFVSQWRALRKERNGKYFFGFGYGADMNGFGSQGGPRHGKRPVSYPFESFDGAVTFKRQRSGEQTYDINVDGVAHYGLYADWIEDLRMLAGERIIDDLARGAEAYLQTWERASGIPSVRCRRLHKHFTLRGVRHLDLGLSPGQVLRRVGQPQHRDQDWRYCIRGKGDSTDELVAVFTETEHVGLIVTDAPRHRAGGVRPGHSKKRLREVAEPVGGGVWLGRAGNGNRFVYGTDGGEVTYVGVVAGAVAGDEGALTGLTDLAGL